jgi:hypothetical protein
MPSFTAESVVRRFWELMSSNDFARVGEVLADSFIAEWPQSNERIRGRSNYTRINIEYPSHGRWVFTLQQLVANASQVVTDVSFTDGVQWARAISFFTVENGEITQMVEYWPENYPAPSNRAHLVEPIA